MKKVFILLIIIITLFTILGCSSENNISSTIPSKTPIPTKTNTPKETPTPSRDNLFKVTYFVNGKKAYFENVNYAKNYGFTNSQYLVLGWYTDEECTSIFDFTTKITADISLYAKTLTLNDIVAEYFKKHNIKSYTFIDDTLRLYVVEEKITFAGDVIGDIGELVVEYTYENQAYDYKADRFILDSKSLINLGSGFGTTLNKFTFNEAYLPSDRWNTPRYDTAKYNYMLRYNITNCDDLNIRIRYYEAFPEDYSITDKIVKRFLEVASSYLTIKASEWKKELYGDQISTGATYSLNVDLNKILNSDIE